MPDEWLGPVLFGVFFLLVVAMCMKGSQAED